jgi:tetratricopeptide (TPR) repeat protein
MSEALLNQAAAALHHGDLSRAEFCYREVLKQEASNFEAYDALATILIQRGRAAEAEPFFVQALRLNPHDAITLSNYGGALEALGRHEEALQHYDRALAVQPDFPDAILNRAAALCLLGRYQETLEGLGRVLLLSPGNPMALYNRGVALAGLERFEEALGAYDAALAAQPNYPEAWSNRGVALSRLKRFTEAVESCDRGMRLGPPVAAALINRGAALVGLKQFGRALADYDQALALEPGNAGAWFNRGVLLTELKRIEDAIQSYEKTLAIAPNYDKAAFNLGLCLLQLGKFEEGFHLYETRRRLAAEPAAFAQPFWSGEDITGQTLLVRGEQGLGDIIQFARYIKLLQNRGIEVILSVNPALIPLLETLTPPPVIIAQDAAPPPCDRHIALESLPYAFKTRLDSIPADIPYLKADPDRAAKWKEKLGEGGFKIGIAWQSSAHGASIGKTFSPSHYQALAKIVGVRLISLQKAEEAAELKNLPSDMIEELGADFDTGSGAFLDSAAVMQSLDLVITSDTALAHLAGALGRPVWVALKHVPDWRWMLDRADTPWYPTMRLFRQPAPDDWAGLFTEMAAALTDVLVRKGSD